MPSINVKSLDVEGLLALRMDIEKTLAERGRDLQRQLALLGGGTGNKRGRLAARTGRSSVLKGKKVAPKYRGPGGETWAGRGATPRWLTALVKEGHSIEEFTIAKGGKRTVTAVKKPAAKKGRKPAPKKRGPKAKAVKEATETVA